MKPVVVICFVFIAIFLPKFEVVAQGVQLSASTQELGYIGKLYKGVNGSPYLHENWSEGTVKLVDGTVFEGLKLMYDQLKDELIFSADENKAQLFMHPVREFTIVHPAGSSKDGKSRYISGLPAMDGATEKSFYEVLVDGKASFLKRTFKKVVEERGLNERVATKHLKASERLFLLKDGKLISIKKDKKSLLNALNDKSKELGSYVQNNRLNLKDEADQIKVIVYYNSLFS